MFQYVVKRLLLMIPTLLGIMILNFVIVQIAPGGPIERAISIMKGHNDGASAHISGASSDSSSAPSVQVQSVNDTYRGRQGIDPELIAELQKMYGFDKPASERFWKMLKGYAQFDFGQSFYRDTSVIALIKEKLPVSISIGMSSTLLIYLIAIPLGIAKALRDGSRFDVWSTVVTTVAYAIPSFLFALLLIVLFAGGSFWQIFPLRGLTSEGWHQMGLGMKILDLIWHIALPVMAIVIGGFATLAMLTKNSFMDEIGKAYVVTARAKGLTEKRILYHHVFRNAMLIVIAGFPSALIAALFTGALMIEVIFSLDGLGLLGYESVINRDYPVVFATLFIYTLIGLLSNLLGDLMYRVVDPRIDFESRA
ncbi:MAG: microcin C ABC transporter permease YejB [Alphaproteobacteria bacterium]|nr:microcin C ABC transporter permease YejB [Alphaproteobacteria bacterium]